MARRTWRLADALLLLLMFLLPLMLVVGRSEGTIDRATLLFWLLLILPLLILPWLWRGVAPEEGGGGQPGFRSPRVGCGKNLRVPLRRSNDC